VPASPAFRQQLWDDLMAAPRAASNAPQQAEPASGSDRGVAQPARPARSRAVWLAAAALLVVLAAVAYVALQRDRPDYRGSIPAAVETATPTPTAIPGVSELTLVDVVIPAEAVPAGVVGGGFSHMTLVPGVQTTMAT
jgi:hypothetical protein